MRHGQCLGFEFALLAAGFGIFFAVGVVGVFGVFFFVVVVFFAVFFVFAVAFVFFFVTALAAFAFAFAFDFAFFFVTVLAAFAFAFAFAFFFVTAFAALAAALADLGHEAGNETFWGLAKALVTGHLPTRATRRRNILEASDAFVSSVRLGAGMLLDLAALFLALDLDLRRSRSALARFLFFAACMPCVRY
jgi:hypothetical protein